MPETVDETTGEVEDTPAPAARAGFSDEQVEQLRAKLDRARVLQREQAGRKLSYIEGWWAIREANRIFGPDGWNRETIEMRLTGEWQTKMGRPPKGDRDPPQRDGWRVGYIARCRVRVRAGAEWIVREGYGSGSGIDADPVSAHENAAKEAETDAMKRALMTFGNPFGLALYDKTQTDVALMPAQQPPVQPQITNGAELPSPAPMTQREADVARANIARTSLKDAIDACETVLELDALWEGDVRKEHERVMREVGPPDKFEAVMTWLKNRLDNRRTMMLAEMG